MAEVIQMNRERLAALLLKLKQSLSYELSLPSIPPKESLTALWQLGQGGEAGSEMLRLLGEGLGQERANIQTLADQLELTDEKSRGHFSGVF